VSPALDVLVALAGFAVSVFPAGWVIGRLLHPFATNLEAETPDRLPGLENAGRMIGWLERTLLYGLILPAPPTRPRS
jgi:hypothetical protein